MDRWFNGALAWAAVLVVSGCNAPPRQSAPSAGTYFEGLGSHTRQITTDSREAQRFFNQGLIWSYAFNHDEAIRSFEAALAHDPECAMAYWGIALCHGPHINNALMPPARRQAAWTAWQQASSLSATCTPAERSLIEALGRRYAADITADRAPLDIAYADAMRAVWRNYPNDADVGTLFAESMMDLRPWDLWTQDARPQPGTEEIVATLERVLTINPNHPGAMHLYIHAVEASNEPGRALAAADRLRTAVPAASHMVHMPSHIDVRVGSWAKASQANERAMAADVAYRSIAPAPPDFYNLYMAHNSHFLAWTSMMEGREAVATRAASDMIAGVPPEWAAQNTAIIDPVAGIQLEVLVRFGRWDGVLAAPAPPATMPISAALWRHARAIAYAAKGDVQAALAEQREFEAAVARVPSDALMFINPAHTALKIASHKTAGEIALARGDLDGAISHLRQGVEIEDTLRYMEPPDWILPVRHTLGAVLLKAGRPAEAEAVYREDLRRWPENGWALLGLTQSLKAQGKSAEAAKAQARFDKAWARADAPIHASCLCVTK